MADGTSSWQVRWREQGRHGPMLSRTCPTEQDAHRLAALIYAHGRLPAEPEELIETSFDQALAVHLEQLTGVTPRTRADYRRDARNHFGLFTGMPSSRVDRALVSQAVNAWQDAGLSSKTISNLHGLLSGVMATAVREGWAPVNPCRGIRLSTW